MTRDLLRLVATALFLTNAGCATAQHLVGASGFTQVKFDESGSNPVLVDGVLYVGSADGAVYALDPKTGERRWRFQTGESLSPATSGPQIITVPPGTSIADQMAAAMKAVEKQKGEGIRRVDMTPAVENGTVFIGSGDRSFYAIDAATGEKKWSYVAGPGMASNNYTSYPIPAAIIENGTVYFVTDDGLHALDVLTGKRKWMFETLQEIPIQEMNLGKKRTPEGPALGDGLIFLTAWPFIGRDTPQKSFLYAVNPKSGTAKWVFSVDGLDITAPTTAKGFVFFVVSKMLYAINAADGQVKWKLGAKKNFGSPLLLIADNTVYFSSDKSLLAVELESGHQLWSFSAGGIKAIDDQHLYAVTHAGTQDTIHALGLTTGQEQWSLNLSESADHVMIHDGVVYAGSEHLYAIDASTGKELWSLKRTGHESPRLISGGRIFLTSPTVSYVGSTRVDQGYLFAIDAKANKLKP
jgi:outer membrane protein assembly factor BamB